MIINLVRSMQIIFKLCFSIQTIMEAESNTSLDEAMVNGSKIPASKFVPGMEVIDHARTAGTGYHSTSKNFETFSGRTNLGTNTAKLILP